MLETELTIFTLRLGNSRRVLEGLPVCISAPLRAVNPVLSTHALVCLKVDMSENILQQHVKVGAAEQLSRFLLSMTNSGDLNNWATIAVPEARRDVCVMFSLPTSAYRSLTKTV